MSGLVRSGLLIMFLTRELRELCSTMEGVEPIHTHPQCLPRMSPIEASHSPSSSIPARHDNSIYGYIQKPHAFCTCSFVVPRPCVTPPPATVIDRTGASAEHVFLVFLFIYFLFFFFRRCDSRFQRRFLSSHLLSATCPIPFLTHPSTPPL